MALAGEGQLAQQKRHYAAKQESRGADETVF